jgi:hypothetical protein
VARRQASAPAIPARRRRKAEAAVAKTPAPLTPEQIRQVKQLAARQAVADMQAQFDEALRLQHAEYLAATGEPMPVGIDQIHERAVAIGRSKGLPRSSEIIGKYTLDDVFEMEGMRLRDQKQLAVLVAEEMAKATPCTSPDEQKRLGAPEHDDDELEQFLVDSWTAYSNDPNLVDRPIKAEWLRKLPQIQRENSPAEKQRLTRVFSKLLRNTLKRRSDKRRKLKPKSPRTK